MEFSAFIHPFPKRISSLHPLGWREIRFPFPVSAHPLLQTLAVAATTCRRIARRAKAKGVAEYAIGYIAAKYAIEYTRPRQQPPCAPRPNERGGTLASPALVVAYAVPRYAASATGAVLNPRRYSAALVAALAAVKIARLSARRTVNQWFRY